MTRLRNLLYYSALRGSAQEAFLASSAQLKESKGTNDTKEELTYAVQLVEAN